MTEIWKAIAGFEGQYDISSLGRVRSLPRAVRQVRHGKPHTIHLKGRILKTRPEHPQVTLPGIGMCRVRDLMRQAFQSSAIDGGQG